MRCWTAPITGSRPGRRYHAYLDLPLNPICWLFGHQPRTTLAGGAAHPWIKTVCRICDRRYTPKPVERHQYQPDEFKTLMLRRIETLRRNGPDDVNQDAKGRTGYNQPTLELNAELHGASIRPHEDGPHWSARFHVGGYGSETPFDAHLDLGFAAAYVSIGGVGHRIANWLGGGERRDLSLSVHSGHVWWTVWVDQSGSTRGLPRWRYGHALYRFADLRGGGKPRYTYTDAADPITVPLAMPEGEYPVTFQLRLQTMQRPKGPILERRWTVIWDAPGGIPFRFDDGWKGGNVYGSGETLWPVDEFADGEPAAPPPERWVPAALASLAARVHRDRERYAWQPEPAGG